MPGFCEILRQQRRSGEAAAAARISSCCKGKKFYLSVPPAAPVSTDADVCQLVEVKLKGKPMGASRQVQWQVHGQVTSEPIHLGDKYADGAVQCKDIMSLLTRRDWI